MTTLLPERPATAGAATVGWGPLAVVLAGTFVTYLDFFIVNVALPSIGTDLHAGSSSLSLVVAGYGLTFAAGMITGGRLGDLFGRRRMFAVGLVLFTLMSAACGLAPTPGTLIVARVLQGVAGALLTPQVLAILGTTYEGKRRASAFAAYGFVMGIAAVAGQLLGGALIQADIAGLDWRSIFLINVPVGLVTLPFVRVVPESRGGGHRRLDLAGTVLGTTAVAALVLPLAEGREHHWPLWTWVLLAAAPLLGAAFVGRQRRLAARGGAPLIDLAVFRVRALNVGSLAGLAFGMVCASFFFVLALYLQVGRGYSALASGAIFGFVGAGYLGAMVTATRAHARLGRQVLTLGALTVAVGCGLLVAAARTAPVAELAPGLLLVGAGIGYVLVPLSATALSGVDARHAGGAAGVLATAQQVGGALGVAVLGSVFFGVGGTIAHAFVVCLGVIAALTLATALLAQLLPRR